jgi:hypothetical protein
MTHAALLLVLIAGYWQPVTVIPDPGYVVSAPMTLTARGNWLYAHNYIMGGVISDMRYTPVEYGGNLYHFDHLKAYTAWQLRQILPDVRHADLAIMTCFTFRGELGRVIYFFERVSE